MYRKECTTDIEIGWGLEVWCGVERERRGPMCALTSTTTLFISSGSASAVRSSERVTRHLALAPAFASALAPPIVSNREGRHEGAVVSTAKARSTEFEIKSPPSVERGRELTAFVVVSNAVKPFVVKPMGRTLEGAFIGEQTRPRPNRGDARTRRQGKAQKTEPSLRDGARDGANTRHAKDNPEGRKGRRARQPRRTGVERGAGARMGIIVVLGGGGGCLGEKGWVDLYLGVPRSD